MRASAGGASPTGPVTILGTPGVDIPGWMIVLTGVALFVISVLTYVWRGQIATLIPDLIAVVIPLWGIIIGVVWILIVIFYGPPDHLKANRFIGLPIAIVIFGVEGFGLWAMAWGGALQAASSQAGGLQGVPSPESWVIPAASGVVWFVASVVIVALSAKAYLYDPRHAAPATPPTTP